MFVVAVPESSIDSSVCHVYIDVFRSMPCTITRDMYHVVPRFGIGSGENNKYFYFSVIKFMYWHFLTPTPTVMYVH